MKPRKTPPKEGAGSGCMARLVRCFFILRELFGRRRLNSSTAPNVQVRQSCDVNGRLYLPIPDASRLEPLIQSMMDGDLNGKWYSDHLREMMISDKCSQETGMPRVVGIEILSTGEVRHQIQIPSLTPRHGQLKMNHKANGRCIQQEDGTLNERCGISEGPCGEVLNSSTNVKEHATPLAGAGVETGVEVHTTGDVADKAASGGCCVSSCSLGSLG